MSSNRSKPVVICHGGAGDIPQSRVKAKLCGVKKAALEGYKILCSSGNILDSIEGAIHVMEDDEAFNAGKGSVLNMNGEVEMEALISEGRSLKSGSVVTVYNVAHPISLARLVMEKTPHAILGGKGVCEFIKAMGVPTVPPESLVTKQAKQALEEFKKNVGGEEGRREEGRIEIGHETGTVGCVVVDPRGHVASGTSTGGMTGKMVGRIGDTPLPGSGGYSDDSVGAVSTTGYGEAILRYNLAQRIIAKMESGKSAQEATKEALNGMCMRLNQKAGAITVSNEGEVGIAFTSKRMAWAYISEDELHFGIEQGEHLIEKNITFS